MFCILKAYGIPDNLVQAIKHMYLNTRAKIQSPEEETKEFNILAGVLQGVTLAPVSYTHLTLPTIYSV